MYKKIILIFICLIFSIYPETINQEEIEKNLNQILQMDSTRRKEYIEHLTSEEIETLLSFIKYKYIKKDKELETVFQLYETLANLKSIAISQKRLNNLLIVIIITLLLFSSYVSYIFIQQNKILKKLQNIEK